MNQLRQLAIQVDRQQTVYQAGEHLTGKVLVKLNAPMIMRGIHLKFVGEADVHWTVRVGQNLIHHRNHEMYFNKAVRLFGKARGDMHGENPILAAGDYAYPFDFTLPPSLPSSFEGDIGSVRYYMEVVIDRPWQVDHMTRGLFTVISLLPLANIRCATYSGTQEEAKWLFCCCWTHGPIIGRLKVKRIGWVPGEMIRFDVEIENHSNRDIKRFRITLNQIRIFHGRQGMGTDGEENNVIEKPVCRVTGPKVKRGDKACFSNWGLRIPPLPPSGLVGCSIIDVEYVLELSVNLPGIIWDMDIPIRLIIGTVPLPQLSRLQQTRNHQGRMVTSGDRPQASSQGQQQPPTEPPTLPDDGLPPYSGPPPSYEECTMGAVNIYQMDDVNEGDEDAKRAALSLKHGAATWTPSYPYYRSQDDDDEDGDSDGNAGQNLPAGQDATDSHV